MSKKCIVIRVISRIELYTFDCGVSRFCYFGTDVLYPQVTESEKKDCLLVMGEVLQGKIVLQGPLDDTSFSYTSSEVANLARSADNGSYTAALDHLICQEPHARMVGHPCNERSLFHPFL